MEGAVTDAEISQVARDILGRVLGQAGFESARTEMKPNHADEDSIFVTVRFHPGVDLTGRSMTGEALVALRDALRDRGEERLPYLIYQFPNDPPPYADDAHAAE